MPWSPLANPSSDSQFLNTVLNDPDPDPDPDSDTPASSTPHVPAHAPANTPPRAHTSALSHSSTHAAAPGASTSANAGPSAFTAAQRSAQARGKPFNNSGSGTVYAATGKPHSMTSASSTSASMTSASMTSAESYASLERRHEAAAILDSMELLMWYAAARNQSVAQTRAYYRGVLLGVCEGAGAGAGAGGMHMWREEWEVRAKGKGKSPKKMGSLRGVAGKRYSGGVGEG